MINSECSCNCYYSLLFRVRFICTFVSALSVRPRRCYTHLLGRSPRLVRNSSVVVRHPEDSCHRPVVKQHSLCADNPTCPPASTPVSDQQPRSSLCFHRNSCCQREVSATLKPGVPGNVAVGGSKEGVPLPWFAVVTLVDILMLWSLPAISFHSEGNLNCYFDLKKCVKGIALHKSSP